MAKRVTIIEDTASRGGRSGFMDDVAYLGPMALFLLFTWAGGHWKSFYVGSYVIKTVLAAAVLILLRRRYTAIRWNAWGWGIVVGVLVLFQWVGMEKLILHAWPDYPRIARPEIFNPFVHFHSTIECWAFIAVRWAGAALVVPFMEELFWRDYLWRNAISPNDFKLAHVGEWDWKAYIIVAIAFGAGVHIEWMTAIVCGLIYGALLAYTRSLGACIIAHGVTNFLLGLYVLLWRDWAFW